MSIIGVLLALPVCLATSWQPRIEPFTEHLDAVASHVGPGEWRTLQADVDVVQVGSEVEWFSFPNSSSGSLFIFNASNKVASGVNEDDVIVFSRHSAPIQWTDHHGVFHSQPAGWNSSFVGLFDIHAGSAPGNVHYVFMSANSSTFLADIAGVKDRITSALMQLGPALQQYWAPRIHYVYGDVDTTAGDLHTIGKTWHSRAGFAIDRFGKWREVGSLYDWENDAYLIAYLQYTGIHFNFEFERHLLLQRQWAQSLVPKVTVTIINPPTIKAHFLTQVDFRQWLPDGAGQPGLHYDTLQVDCSFTCTGDTQVNCPHWDRIASLYLCESEQWSNIYNQSQCTEMTRWITSYRRQGRWVTDISPFLARIFEADGSTGNRTFIFDTWDAMLVDIKFHFSRQGKGYRPLRIVPLWRGGSFNLAYNTLHPPRNVTVPPEMARMEVVAWITGHGWGTDIFDCAEFCPTEHRFFVNNAPPHMYNLSNGGTTYGCRDLVNQGVLPNQFGTWPYGRAGWCPGWNVPLFAANVTNDVLGRSVAVLSYTGTFHDHDFNATAAANPHPLGFAAEIRMSSFVVIYSNMTYAPPAATGMPTPSPTAFPTRVPTATPTAAPSTAPSAAPAPSPTSAGTIGFGMFERVVLVGIDGLQVKALHRLLANGTMPTLAQMRARGVYTDKCRSVQPSMSLPNWASALYGASPSFHGVRSNGWTRQNSQLPPVRGRCFPYPNLFSVARQQRTATELPTLLAYSWSTLGDLLQPNRSLAVDRTINAECDTCEGCWATEENNTKAFVSSLSSARAKLSFLYIDSMDECGHGYGTESGQYAAAGAHADRWLKRVLDTLDSGGMLNSTLVLVITDHGRERCGGYGHGGFSEDEMNTQWLAYSTHPEWVTNGLELDAVPWPVSITDTSPTLLHALGLLAPPEWRGRPVLPVFGGQPQWRYNAIFTPQTCGTHVQPACPTPAPPSMAPTASPTEAPTTIPTSAPSATPTYSPSSSPSRAPSTAPTSAPLDQRAGGNGGAASWKSFFWGVGTGIAAIAAFYGCCWWRRRRNNSASTTYMPHSDDDDQAAVGMVNLSDDW